MIELNKRINLRIKGFIAALAAISLLSLSGSSARAESLDLPIEFNQSASQAVVDILNQDLGSQPQEVRHYVSNAGNYESRDEAPFIGAAIRVFSPDTASIGVCRLSDILNIELTSQYNRTSNINPANSAGGISVGGNLSTQATDPSERIYGVNAVMDNIKGFRLHNPGINANYNAAAIDWTAWPGSVAATTLPTELGARWSQVSNWDITVFAGLTNFSQTQPVAGQFVSVSKPMAKAEFKSDNACSRDDADGDGIPSSVECGSPAGQECKDTDGDGIYNYMDTDSDSDGKLDKDEGTIDIDADGIANYIDNQDDVPGRGQAANTSSVKVPNTGYAVILMISIPIALASLIYIILHHRGATALKDKSQR